MTVRVFIQNEAGSAQKNYHDEKHLTWQRVVTVYGAEQIDNPAADANPATAHMFIINPLHGGLSGLFASHPSTEERIARLKTMAQQMGQGPKPGPWS